MIEAPRCPSPPSKNEGTSLMQIQPASPMSSSLTSSNSKPAGPSPHSPQPLSSMHAGSPMSVVSSTVSGP